MLSMLMYSVAWAEPKDIPLFQGLTYSLFPWGKIISSVVFSVVMVSARAQLLFFVCITVLSLASSVAFFCTLALTQQGSRPRAAD